MIIRLIEGDPTTRAPLESRLVPLRGTGRFLLTSYLSRLECRVKPMRENDALLLAEYEGFFASIDIELVELSADVVEKATELRARHNLKTPDSLHIASAILGGATVFVTGDRSFERCAEIAVEIL